MSDKKIMVNLSPAGMIPRTADVPHVKTSPKAIALDVKRCHELGVSMVHLHARDEEENPTWEPKVFEDIIQEIKVHTPDIITIVTTSGRN